MISEIGTGGEAIRQVRGKLEAMPSDKETETRVENDSKNNSLHVTLNVCSMNVHLKSIHLCSMDFKPVTICALHSV